MSVSALHLSFITSLVAQELRWWEWHRVGTSPLESSPHLSGGRTNNLPLTIYLSFSIIESGHSCQPGLRQSAPPVIPVYPSLLGRSMERGRTRSIHLAAQMEGVVAIYKVFPEPNLHLPGQGVLLPRLACVGLAQGCSFFLWSLRPE